MSESETESEKTESEEEEEVVIVSFLTHLSHTSSQSFLRSKLKI